MPNVDLGQVIGPAGTAAGFGTVSATVDGNTGTPAVTVTASGPDTAKQFAFAFSNLKGATGAQGEDGPNEVSTDTATAMIGVLAGNGSSVETLDTGAYTNAQIAQAIKDAAVNANSTGFAPKEEILYFTSQTVSAASNAQIMRIPASGTNSNITTDTVVLGCVFANPAYITGDVSWTSYAGYVAFTGTCTTATTASVILGQKGN